MNSVVGDGDGMAKRAPVRCSRQGARRLGRLGQFPHAGHERGFSRALHQPDFTTAIAIALAPVKGTPDLFLSLAGERIGARHFSLRDTPLPDWAHQAAGLARHACVPREPRCLVCPVRKWCVTQGEVPRADPLSRQRKKQIWCALDRREGDGNGSGKVRLVQRPRKASLMPGMWELPQSSEPPRPLPAAAYWRTFRHSITITDYTVHVLRSMPLRNTRLRNTPLLNTPPAAKGKWIAIDRIPQIPITGLTRKILKAGGII